MHSSSHTTTLSKPLCLALAFNYRRRFERCNSNNSRNSPLLPAQVVAEVHADEDVVVDRMQQAVGPDGAVRMANADQNECLILKTKVCIDLASLPS